MNYLLIKDDSTEFWIETNNDSIAVRQLIIMDKQIQISCKTDCLAEGIIEANDMSGDVRIITSDIFEEKWDNTLFNYLDDWQIQKEKHCIGKTVCATIKYFYPQGTILQIGDTQGICNYNDGMHLGDTITGKIVAHDDKNQWLKIQTIEQNCCRDGTASKVNRKSQIVSHIQ